MITEEGNRLIAETFKERGYSIICTGIIIGVNGQPRKLGKNRSGYFQINLMIGGRQKTYMVHRLVAELYVPNPDNLPEVNHKDGNKENNRCDNLEWCTREQNIQHGYDNGLIGKHMVGKTGIKHHLSRPVSQHSMTGELVAEFGSIREAGRISGVGKTINDALKGRLKSAGGFIWKYKE